MNSVLMNVGPSAKVGQSCFSSRDRQTPRTFLQEFVELLAELFPELYLGGIVLEKSEDVLRQCAWFSVASASFAGH